MRRVISREPASVRANYLLSETLLDTEHVREADEVIRKAVALSPDSADLRQAQGDIDFRKGDIAAAEKDYKTAYHIDPKHARAIYGIARIFECAALNGKAAALFRVAHALDPRDGEIVGNFARFSARDSEEAVAALEKYLSTARGEQRRRLQAFRARIEMRKFLVRRGTEGLPWIGIAVRS